MSRTREQLDRHAEQEREYRRLKREERLRLKSELRSTSIALVTRHGYTVERLLCEIFDIQVSGSNPE